MRGRAAIAILVLARAVSGEDTALTPAEHEAVDRATRIVRRGVDVQKLREADHALRSIPADRLRRLHFDDPDDDRKPLLHAARSIAFARAHEKDLGDPWKIALRIGSPDARERYGAFRALRRRKFDAGLARTATALTTDPRPDVRLAAGRLLKTMAVFGEAGEDAEKAALRLLDDPMPNVTALFAIHDAHSFDRLAIMDRMVALRRDPRDLVRAEGLLEAVGTVGRYVRSRLGQEFHSWRYVPCTDRAPDARHLRNWWKQHRANYRSGPDPKASEVALDWKGVCALGGRTSADGPKNTFSIEVRSYEEGWVGQVPVYSAAVFVWEKSGDTWSSLGGGGPNDACDGTEIRRLSWTGGRSMWFEFHLAPTDGGKVRVRARIWEAR